MSRAAALAAVVLLLATPVAWSRVDAGARGGSWGSRPRPSSVGGLPIGRGGSWKAGEVLFRTKGCAQCHDGPDTTARMGEFPDLSDARSWAGLRRPGLSAAGYLRQSIRDPAEFLSPAWTPWGGDFGMPQLTVTEAEVDALVDYLLAR